MTIEEQKPTAESASVAEDIIVDLDAPEGDAAPGGESNEADSPTVVVANQPETTSTHEQAAPDEEVEEGDLTQEEWQHLKGKTQKRIQTLARKAKNASLLEQELARARQELEARESRLKELENTSFTAQEQNLAAQKARAQSELDAAKQAWLKADDDGNRAAVLEANERMVTARAQMFRLEEVERGMANRKAKAAKAAENPQTEQRRAPNVDPVIVQRDQQRAQKWLSENSWANPASDEHSPVMAAAVQAIHQQLVSAEGFNPWSEDASFGREAYYAELDSRMRREFPQKFTKGSKPNSQSKTPVTGAPRTPVVPNKNQVRLTPSEVDTARRLGLTLKEYAQEKLKIQRERGDR